MNDELFNALKNLALYIIRTVDKKISDGTIQSEERISQKWKIDKFQYTDNGIGESSAHTENIVKQSWHKATLTIQEAIKKSEIYDSTLKQIAPIFAKNKPLYGSIITMDTFVYHLIYRCLSDTKFSETDIDVIIEASIKDLWGEPIKCNVKIELEGIILQPEKLNITENILIRKPQIEDLEKELTEYTSMLDSLSYPSAILDIRFEGRLLQETRIKIEQAVAILRLFKVGSVRCTSYSMSSDSIVNPTSLVPSLNVRFPALERYLLTEENIPKIKEFWQIMTHSLPKNFYEFGTSKIDFTAIAYNRYTDSLLQNGLLERRIANVIMGLEALFFKPEGEMQELAYRLRIRVSKLLGLLGYDPYEVKEIVNDAYEIRSLFLHGGHLGYKKRRKIESQYKNIKSFLLPLLDYLRTSIIAMVLMRREKEEFIDLIDDSLIDSTKEKQLIGVISEVKKFVWRS